MHMFHLPDAHSRIVTRRTEASAREYLQKRGRERAPRQRRSSLSERFARAADPSS